MAWAPQPLLIGHAQLPLKPATRDRLSKLAEGIDLPDTSDMSYSVGTTWFGKVQDIQTLATATLSCLSIVLNSTFGAQAAAEGLSLAEWLADTDWHAHLQTDSAEGLAAWNPARALTYASVLAVHALPLQNISWQQDMRLAPPPDALRRLSMQDAAAFELPPSFDAALLLRSTAAFCKGWQRGTLGPRSSALAFAGLIACQASQQALPDSEQRYAAHVA